MLTGLNPRYGVDVAAEAKRRQSAAWHALNQFVTQEGGFVVTPPGRMLRVEVAKDSALPAQLKNCESPMTFSKFPLM